MNPYQSSDSSQEVEIKNSYSVFTKMIIFFVIGLILFLGYWQVKRHYDVRKNYEEQQKKLKQTEVELRKLEKK